MLPTTGGAFCASCGFREKAGTIFDEEPKTPPLGTPAVGDDAAVTDNLPAAGDMGGTLLFDMGSLDELPESPPLPGNDSQIEESHLHLHAMGDTDQNTTLPWGDGISIPEETTAEEVEKIAAAAGGFNEEPEDLFAQDGDENEGATMMMGVAELPSAAAFVEPPEDEEPPPPEEEPDMRLEPLVMPRCESCGESLELEETHDGICTACKEDEEERNKLRIVRPAAKTFSVMAAMFVAFVATWIGVLFIIDAVRSNPDTWQTAETTMALMRGIVILFVIASAMLWAWEHPWAGGVGLAVGPLAVFASLAMLTSGLLIDNLSHGWGWLLGLMGGAVFVLSASIPVKEIIVGGGKKKAPRRSGRGKARGRNSSGGGNARAIVGGVVALLFTVLSVWIMRITVGGEANLFSSLNERSIGAAGLIVAAFVGVILALLMFFAPPDGSTYTLSLVAVALATSAPVLIFVIAQLTGDASALTGASALPIAVSHFLGLGSILPAEMPLLLGWQKGVFVLALLGGISCCIVTLVKSRTERGRSIAGFGLGWGVLWTAALVIAMVN